MSLRLGRALGDVEFITAAKMAVADAAATKMDVDQNERGKVDLRRNAARANNEVNKDALKESIKGGNAHDGACGIFTAGKRSTNIRPSFQTSLGSPMTIRESDRAIGTVPIFAGTPSHDS